jgi:D-psicose/D-tagatose/L-ribulose 3-epimerase
MNNKIGMNLLLWGTEINESLFPVLEEIAAIGFTGVEVPIFDTQPERWRNWRKKLDELRLDCVAVTINGPGHSLISSDPAERKKTIEQNKAAIDCAAVLGSGLLTGPFHSALGVFSGKPATADELNYAAEGLHELSVHAARNNIVLGLEYLNRFESYLVSCTDELISLTRKADHPNCRIMFDTFHANIEEKSIPDAIRKIGELLVHVQLSENDRGSLGAGHINFTEILNALSEIGYSGMLSIEAFSMKLAAANIWRPMFESETQLMKDSYKFLKNITK